MMRNFILKTFCIFLFVCFSISLTSCKKSNDPQPDKPKETVTLEYTLDGTRVAINGNLDSLSKTGMGAFLTAHTNGSDETTRTFILTGQTSPKDLISINLNTKTLEQKSYHLGSLAASGNNWINIIVQQGATYNSLGDDSYVDVKVSNVSATSASGTFSGVVSERTGSHKNENGQTIYEYKYHQLTDGKFNDIQVMY